MFSLIRSLAGNRRLLKDFVIRDLKARYVGSTMGFFWSVIFPIINLFVYMFVFRLVLKARWSDHQGPLEVALVMLAGIVVWAAFAETVSRSTNCLVENSNLIQKVVFPSEVLPVYLTLSSLVNMAIGFPVVILCVLWFAYLSPPEVSFLLPREEIEVEGQRQLAPVPIAFGERAQEAAHARLFLSRGWNRDISIPIEFAGTAERGVDYHCELDRVEIPSGRLSVDLGVTPVADREVEETETILIRIGELEGASLGESPELRMELIDGIPLGADEEPIPVAAASIPGAEDPSYHPLQMGLSVLSLPLLFALQALFTIGLGLILSTLNILLRDTYHLVGVGITVWMFGTPIFYPAAMVRDAHFGILLALNPMYWLIDGYRAVLLYGQWPDPILMLQLALVGGGLFLLGGRFFKSQQRRFPDLL